MDPTREELLYLGRAVTRKWEEDLAKLEHKHEYELIEVCKVCGITGEIVEPE